MAYARRPGKLKVFISYSRQNLAAASMPRSCRAAAADHERYREKASGKSTRNRPELEKAIDMLGTHDVLVLAEWDRATRSLMDGIEIMRRITSAAPWSKFWTSPAST